MPKCQRLHKIITGPIHCSHHYERVFDQAHEDRIVAHIQRVQAELARQSDDNDRIIAICKNGNEVYREGVT